MKGNYRYYVYRRDDGSCGRLARIGGKKGELGAYGYQDGKWVDMPSLFKIENDITDYEDITEAEALEIMAEIDKESK